MSEEPKRQRVTIVNPSDPYSEMLMGTAKYERLTALPKFAKAYDDAKRASLSVADHQPISELSVQVYSEIWGLSKELKQ